MRRLVGLIIFRGVIFDEVSFGQRFRSRAFADAVRRLESQLLKKYILRGRSFFLLEFPISPHDEVSNPFRFG